MGQFVHICAVCGRLFKAARSALKDPGCSHACRQSIRYWRSLGPTRLKAHIAVIRESIAQQERLLAHMEAQL